MNETEKSIWTRHLPNFSRFVLTLVTPLLRVVLPLVSPRMLRRYLFCLFCLVTTIALFYAEEDLRGKYAWESYARQSKEKGLDLDWHAYVPPPVPDDQNFAMTPPFEGFFDYERTTNNVVWRDTNIWSRESRVTIISAAEPATELGDWMRGHPLDLKKWQAYFRNAKLPETNYWPVPGQPQAPAQNVLFALRKIAPDLEAIRKASTRPQSRFPIHYEELPNAIIVHLAFLHSASQVLQLRAVAYLESGNNQEALADVNLAFYCADAIKSEPFMISRIVRCRIIEEDLQPIWEGLRTHRWSNAQLKEFERYFSKADLLSQYEQSVKAHLAFICGWIESLPEDAFTEFMTESGTLHSEAVKAAINAHLLPRGWFYQNELSAARFFHETSLPDVASQTQRVYPSLSRTNMALFDQLPNTPYSIVFKLFGSVVSPQKFVRAQTHINLALVACALERYRMAQGHFPETLDGLAPEFLEKLPYDIINGEPLKYRLTGPGKFILYSVGWNEKDDGGTYPGPVAPNNLGFRELFNYHPETGDWVWQYPN